MGHSYIELEGQSAHLNDADIDIARHFLICAAQTLPSSTEIESLRAFLSEWQNYGPGVFGADLGQFIEKSTARRSLFLRVIALAIDLAKRFGEQVPVEYLSTAQLSSGVFLGDYPVRGAIETLGKLHGLVTGDSEKN